MVGERAEPPNLEKPHAGKVSSRKILDVRIAETSAGTALVFLIVEGDGEK
jgi:hypothetical protein